MTATKIRVVDTKQSLADVFTLDLPELRTVLADLARGLPLEERQTVLTFEYLVAAVNTLKTRGSASTSEMAEVVLRRLLYSDAVVPVVVPPWTAGREREGIRVRPGGRKVAVASGGRAPLVLAAEEAADVVGLDADPRGIGSDIVETFGGEKVVHVLTGAYVAPVMAVLFTRAGRLPGVELRPDIDDLEATRRQLEAASQYFLSGAAAVAAVRLAESLRRLPPAAARLTFRPGGLPSGATLEYLLGELARVYPDVAPGPGEFRFRLSPLVDAFRVGAVDAYLWLVVEGRDSARAAAFLARAAGAAAAARRRTAARRAATAAVARARQLREIVGDKFGARRERDLFAALAGDPDRSPDSPRDVLLALEPRERSLVAAAYDGRQAEWEAWVANDCPHVRIARRLRATASDLEAVKILQQLAAYYAAPFPAEPGRGKKSTPDTWIYCKNCKFRVVCPHVDELVRMRARNVPYDTARTRLARYAVRYSDRTDEGVATTYSYFCKICSERLSSYTGGGADADTAALMGAVGTLEDYVRKVIWGEAVAAARLVRFPVPTDSRRFASTAADVCYPLLLRAEERILRQGRRLAPERGDDQGAADADPYGDAETVDPRTRFYAVVFVYAYIYNLIQSGEKTLPGMRIGFEGVKPGARPVVYVQTILATIRRRHSGLIARLEDASNEFIADRFRMAFRYIHRNEGFQELTSVDAGKVIANLLVELDPIYHYAAATARVFGPLRPGPAAAPAAARREFETVMGAPLPRIATPRPPEKMTKLEQTLLGIRLGGRLVPAEYPRGYDPVRAPSIPAINLYVRLFRGGTAAKRAKSHETAFARLRELSRRVPHPQERVVDTIVGGRHRPTPAKKPGKPTKGRKSAKKSGKRAKTQRPGKQTGGFKHDNFLRAAEWGKDAAGLYAAAYVGFVEYTTDTSSADQWDRYTRRLALLREAERGFLLRRIASAAKNFRWMVFDDSRRFLAVEEKAPARFSLGYRYDENGVAHTWTQTDTKKSDKTIYIYEDGAGARAEYRRAEIGARIAAARRVGETRSPLAGWRLADLRCSVCELRLSEIGTLDPARIRESLRALSVYEAFFKFYQSRCPEGDLHEFSRKKKGGVASCSKCGMSELLVFNYNDPDRAAEARKYFDKYFSSYQSRREERRLGQVFRERPGAAPREAAAPDAWRGFADGWAPDYGLLVRAAELAEVPVRALETVGDTEGRLYEDVLAGASAPLPPSVPGDPRLLAADSAVRVFVVDYNRLRFLHRLGAPGPGGEGAGSPAARLVREAGVPPYEVETLPDRLPDVAKDYADKYQAVLQWRGPGDAYRFSIETLARMTVEVGNAPAKKTPEWMRKLRRTFAQKELQKIVRSERLLAKNGPFNFASVFGGESSSGADDDINDTVAGDVGEDVLDQIVAEDADVGEADPFSLEAVDISPDNPNLEPQ